MDLSAVFAGKTTFPEGMPPDRHWLDGVFDERDLTDPPGRRLTGGNNVYSWLVAAGYCFKPRKVGEIGIRFGYSINCILTGLAWQGMSSVAVWGIDNDSAWPGSLIQAMQNVKKKWPGAHVNLFCQDSQKQQGFLGIPEEIDLFHVDGLHTAEAVYHDLNLAWGATRPGGVILCDDVETDEGAHRGLRRFCREKRVGYTVLPSQDGLAVVHKPERAILPAWMAEGRKP